MFGSEDDASDTPNASALLSTSSAGKNLKRITSRIESGRMNAGKSGRGTAFLGTDGLGTAVGLEDGALGRIINNNVEHEESTRVAERYIKPGTAVKELILEAEERG